jgi:dipeptidyl aminopeptidase/acylaminoacyl peptidase
VPGVEKNLDLAYALRDAGWNALYFHYRGCWGSEGDYDFHGIPADVRAATDWVLTQPCVDPQRLALVGSSMGGYMTLYCGAYDDRFKALVPLCPLVDPTSYPLPLDLATDFATMLNGVTPEALAAQWNSLTPLQNLTDKLSGRDILLVTGDEDELFAPSHFQPLVEALPALTWHRFAEGDHAFSTCRRAVVQRVVEWLNARV